MSDFYGTMVEAIEYFNDRLHSRAWDNSSVDDKRKALIGATRIIDTLNYKGYKAPVHALFASAEEANSTPSDEEVREAEASQQRAFPRGTDTEVPTAIKRACYEIAIALLEGRDPDLELESLAVSSQGIESVRTTYTRTMTPIEHLINGVPSNAAWRLLRPFLRDDKSMTLKRV